MGVQPGDQFMVMADKDVVMLKIIQPPAMGQFQALAAKARKSAKQAGLTKNAVKQAIKTTRKK